MNNSLLIIDPYVCISFVQDVEGIRITAGVWATEEREIGISVGWMQGRDTAS